MSIEIIHTDHRSAEALNQRIQKSKANKIFLLGEDCLQSAGWLQAMENALAENSIAVGNTILKHSKNANPVEKLGKILFANYSKDCAHAQGHTLPWGPADNLAFTKKSFEKIGPFSVSAGSAYDVDWCWRAMLQGESIAYAPQAKVTKRLLAGKEEFLLRMESYGRGEAWLQHAFSFLVESPASSPYSMAMASYRRLGQQEIVKEHKSLLPLLLEASTAHALGVLAAAIVPTANCPQKREIPKQAVHWKSAPKEITVFVPGKGITSLHGKALEAWQLTQSGADEHELAHYFEKAFRLSHEEAHEEAENFLAAFQPS